MTCAAERGDHPDLLLWHHRQNPEGDGQVQGALVGRVGSQVDGDPAMGVAGERDGRSRLAPCIPDLVGKPIILRRTRAHPGREVHGRVDARLARVTDVDRKRIVRRRLEGVSELDPQEQLAFVVAEANPTDATRRFVHRPLSRMRVEHPRAFPVDLGLKRTVETRIHRQIGKRWQLG
ncbi:hypothetical protein D3C87_1633820 [compost metagenome]